MNSVKTELFHDNFQNYKKYGIPKAQLVIADIPYNIAGNAYASNPMWYKGEITKTGKASLQRKRFLIPMGISKSQSICISVRVCLKKSQRRKTKPRR